MSNQITGKEYPLDKIFSSDFEYHIPVYQRPYAWTEDETGKLFDDLNDFFSTRSAENYFLGSIVMIKDENKRYADVIDGQQRLTTLYQVLKSKGATITRLETERDKTIKRYYYLDIRKCLDPNTDRLDVIISHCNHELHERRKSSE